jgi:hypothetical protein
MRLRPLLSVLFVVVCAGCGDACDPAGPPPPPSTTTPGQPATAQDPAVKGVKSAKVDLDKIFGTPPDAAAE